MLNVEHFLRNIAACYASTAKSEQLFARFGEPECDPTCLVDVAETPMQFYDRYEAGDFLAEQLTGDSNKADVIVLALTCGGAAVASRVAKRLNSPLELFAQDSTGMDSSGLRFLRSKHQDTFPLSEIKGTTVILVDDGIDNDSALFSSITELRRLGAERIVVAAPVIAATTYDRVRNAADDVATVIVPEKFDAIGQFYGDFSQVRPEEVRHILSCAARTFRHRAIAA